MTSLRDTLLDAPANLDPEGMPEGFAQARDAIRRGIRDASDAGATEATQLAVLLSEALPRLVDVYGPARAAIILSRIAHDIASGLAPHCRTQ